MSDPPLEPLPGDARMELAEVIDFGTVRLRRGRSNYRTKQCAHRSMIYSHSERRVWCEDCNRTIENFDAFTTLVVHFEEMARDARHRLAKANEALQATIHRRATKAVDKAWSGSLPALGCPHCGGGILPEDWQEGAMSQSSREYEVARRARKNGKP